MPNFSFLGCLEVVVLFLETNNKKLEASLAPVEAEVGVVAKADQNNVVALNKRINNSFIIKLI